MARGCRRSTAIFATEVARRARGTTILRSMCARRPIVMRHVAHRPTVALRTNTPRRADATAALGTNMRCRAGATTVLGTEVPCRTGAAAALRATRARRAIVMPHISYQPTVRAAAATRGDDSMARKLPRP